MSAELKKRVTVNTLKAMKQAGEKIVCLTAYDASFAGVLDQAGVDVVLVGDSLGMVVQGHDTTLPVTMQETIYHAQAVARGLQRPLLLVDLPFMSYATKEDALYNAGLLMKQAGAHMVKLEGGAVQAETVSLLVGHGIPVCAHLGLQPQSVHKLGGYRVQGRDDRTAVQMLEDAALLAKSGADMLVLECVPQLLAQEISANLDIPVIGIGAGADCDGQVLVLYDILGLSDRAPRFAKNYLQQGGSIQAAVAGYVEEVKQRRFPTAAQTLA